MVEVSGWPIIEHQIRAYLSAGAKIEEIVVVLGHKSQIATDFLYSKYHGIRVIINNEYAETNNMYSLYLALEKINMDKKFELFLSNGDCIYDPDIIKTLFSIKFSCIAADKSTFSDENMKITLNEDKTITSISKDISKDHAYGNSIDLYHFSYNDVLIFEKEIRRIINQENDYSQWTELAINAILPKTKISLFEINRKSWVEIDNHEDLKLAKKMFQSDTNPQW